MAFCFMIGIAGGVNSQKSALADALCEAYSHRSVIHLKMEDYRKPVENLPLVTLQNGEQCRDEYSPEAYDLLRMRDDIADIMYNIRCRILVVEGSLILWYKGIEELCDARVYIDGPDDEQGVEVGEVVLTDSSSLIRDRHNRFVTPSKAEADIPVMADDGIERGVWKIKKALWGLWL